MLIGVDATPYFGIGAGISRYLTEMLRAVMTAVPEDRLILYSPRPVEVPLPSGRWQLRIPGARRPHTPGRWLRHALPRMMAEDGVEVFWGQSTVMPLRRLHPCRTVLTVHDLTGLLYPHTMEFGTRLYWRVNFQAAVRAADTVVMDSMATNRLLHRLLSVSPDRTIVVYPGRPTALIPSPDADAELAAARFALPKRFVLSVGTLEPRKDYPTLLRALRLIRRPPLLAIAGTVGWRSWGILRAVRAAESDGLVKYLGRVSDVEMAALYSRADVMVYPSFYEGFGFPVLEAMTHGCPVLCSWSSSLPEVGGTAACYFRPRNAHDLARRLEELLQDESRLADMKSKGVIQSSHFSFHRAAAQLMEVLHAAPGAHRGGL